MQTTETQKQLLDGKFKDRAIADACKIFNETVFHLADRSVSSAIDEFQERSKLAIDASMLSERVCSFACSFVRLLVFVRVFLSAAQKRVESELERSNNEVERLRRLVQR